ncbi:TPA: host specificity factor TipJ family phage tail protein, partial [Escherichia coli]
MALILHYTRNEDGTFDRKRYNVPPMEYVVANIPDGVPVRIYRGEIGDDTDVTENFEALKEDDVFHIIEGAGGGGGFLGKLLDPLGVLKFVTKLISPSQKTPKTSLANQQAESPNNSLTDRNNKPRPYERSYDICGRVQTIPNNLMTTYKVFNDAGVVVEYGYYDAGRGYLDIKAEDITDGDTKVQEITGTSVAVYAPFTSPNNTNTPQLLVGDPINQNLYITIASNEVDGVVLKAQNDIRVNPSDTGDISLQGATGVVRDNTGDSAFSEILSVGDIAVFNLILVKDVANVSGSYTVTYVDDFEVRVAAGGMLSEWQKLPSGFTPLTQGTEAWISPSNTYDKSLTDWTTLNRLEIERVVANIAAANGMYKDNGSKLRTSVTVEIQYQLLDETGVPYGDVYSKQAVISGRSADYTGVTIYADLPMRSKVRVRARRVTDLDLSFEGTVVDEVSYINLYGQVRDTTPHYGNRTTVHSARKQTPRAAEIKQPQLRMIATEMVYKYLGNGAFDTVMTPNTQAIQSLIRLARDPAVGNLNLTTSNMDKLLATQTEIENYFGNAEAGQFCYTFDDYKMTMQDIISTIADAIFCTPYRKGQDILLDFERPRMGPEMVFTHRSKTTAAEKWTRTFNDAQVYD